MHKDISVKLGAACRLNKHSFHPSFIADYFSRPLPHRLNVFMPIFCGLDDVTGQFQGTCGTSSSTAANVESDTYAPEQFNCFTFLQRF